MTDLQWTDEPPSEAGVYWYLDTWKSPSVVNVKKFGDTLYAKFFIGSKYPIRELPGQWAGPIPEPSERTEHQPNR